MIRKIIVDSEEAKQELLEASKHIHDSRDIDTSIPTVNALAHLYQAEYLIEVQKYMVGDECVRCDGYDPMSMLRDYIFDGPPGVNVDGLCYICVQEIEHKKGAK